MRGFLPEEEESHVEDDQKETMSPERSEGGSSREGREEVGSERKKGLQAVFVDVVVVEGVVGVGREGGEGSQGGVRGDHFGQHPLH